MYKFFLGDYENVPKDFWGFMRMIEFKIVVFENVRICSRGV